MASIWYIGSGGAARAIGALVTPIFTRLLTPEEYGLYPLYTSWLGVLSVIMTLELTGSTIYRGYQRYGDKKDEFTSCALGLIGSLFVVFCTLYFAFFNFFNKITGLNIKISIFMVTEIFASAIISLYIAKAKYEYRYHTVAILNLISALLAPFGAVAFIFLTDIRAEARIYSSIICAVLLSLPIAITLLHSSSKLYDKNIWRYLFLRAIGLLPHYLATSLILKSVEIGIGRSHGTDALGKYSIAMSIGMILTVITGGLSSALSPWILRRVRDGGFDKIKDLLLLCIKVISLVCLLILAFAPEVISFLAPDSFHSALPSVYPLEISVILSFLAGSVMSGCTYYERSILTSVPSIISALVSILLSTLVLPRMSYSFSGILPFICYLVLALLCSLLFKHFSGTYPISIRGLFTVLLPTLVYAFILYLFRGVLISRIFLALPPAFLLLLISKRTYQTIRE